MSIQIVNIKSSAKYDVYCGRGSIFGNPYTHIKYKKTLAEFVVNTRDESIDKYKEYFYNRINTDVEFKNAVINLKGKTCACFCFPARCHLNIIKEWLDNYNENN